MFVKWILKYYGLNDTENLTITSMVEDLNNTYAGKVLVSTDAIHEELESHFLRQKEQRKEKIYETLRFQEMLREIDNTKISYIMTKPILDMYLSELHGRIATIYGTSLSTLKNDTLLDFYYNNISTIDDIYECHKEFKEIIYVFLTIFLYLLKCPQSLILSALRAFCFCGKPHISRSIFLYFRYQAWLKSW